MAGPAPMTARGRRRPAWRVSAISSAGCPTASPRRALCRHVEAPAGSGGGTRGPAAGSGIVSEARLPPDPDLPAIAAAAAALVQADRRALAQAITLVESSRPDHRPLADRLLEILLPRTGRSIRIGISGAPGVGKSTFIESFGLHVLSRGHRRAVLAVAPASRAGARL